MRWSFQAAAFFAIIGVSLAAGARAADLRPDSSRIVSVASAFPLVFEENRGQADSTVRFLSRSPGFDLLLRSDEAVFVLRGRERTAERISLRWRGAACEPEVFGDELLASKSSDFHGSDPSRWLRGIDQYGRVTYPELYPGIGLSFYGSAGRLEHDFFVSAGADPRSIRLEIAGARRVRIDARGDLILSTESGDVVARAPEIYQSIAGRRVAVAGGWTLRSPRHAGGPAEAGFEIGRYDRGAPLVIDPILSYATYLGGTSSDNGYGIAVDGQGNAYVVGAAFSGDFPLQNPIDDSAVSGDAFVTKLSNGGSTLMYSTRLGGSGFDNGYGIALDSSGNAYVSGTTFSTDFPTTPGAYRETAASSADVWVAKLNATGTALVYATRIGHFAGGSNEPRYTSVAVDSGGNAYVTGVTDALDFPTTPGAFSRTLGTQPFNGGYNTDAFVTKLNPAGSALVYSTYLGGIGDDGGYGIRVDGAGSAYVTGVAGTNGFNQSDFPTTPGAYQQAAGHSGNASFVAKLKPDGSGLVFATLVGGTIGQSQGFGIAIDGEGCSYVTGETTPHFTGQNDFPTTPGAVQPAYGGSNADAFAYKLNASGSGLVYSTFLGGSGYENVFGSGGIAVDGNHDAYVIGHTASNNFPTSHSLQVYKGGGFTGDAFLVKLNPTGTALAYSTFLGGTKDEYGADVAVDAVGNAYVTGTTFSSDFPATPNSFQTSSKGFSSVFIAKIGELTSFDVAAVVPNEGGDTGTAAVLVEGAGFQPGVSVKLRRSGHADIVGDPLGLSPDGTSLDTLFDLHGAAQGTWDLVVTNPGGGSATLAGGFTVTPGRAADLWVDVVGSPNLRGGKSQRYQIVYGNRSPDAALGTLLWIAFPKYLDYKLDFALTPPPLPPGVPAVDFSQIPISFDTDTETVIPLFIGVIPSGITGTLPIELRVPDDPQYAHAKFEIRVWMNAPFFGSPLDPQAEKCLRTVTKTILSRVMEVLIKKFMPVDCVTGAGSAMKEIFENTLEAIVKGQQGTYNGADAAKSLTQMLCPALQQGLECAFELSGLVVPEVKVLQVVLEIIPFLLDLNEVLDDCGNPLSPKFGRNFPAEVITSNDPNDKFGSVGGGAPAHFLTGSEPLRYVVHFTNEDTATAPAQDVVVTDQLDPAKVDLSTFAFGPISFGAITVFPSSPTGDFNRDVDLRPERNLIARIASHLNPGTGLIEWRFSSIDPETGQPTEDATAGFLPPDAVPPEGEGAVSFTVSPKALATGTEIRNHARIVFDVNPPIDTPEWLNTIDVSAPSSHVLALPASESSAAFTVHWSGSDTGSGILEYTVFVSEDGGPFEPFVAQTLTTSATFAGAPGHAYAFYSVARDQAGNLEAPPASPDTTTAVSEAAPAADLSVFATLSGNANPGANLTVTLEAHNAGPSAATSVSLGNAIPANTTFVSISQTAGPAFACAHPSVGATGTVTCTLASFASGVSADFHLVVKVGAGTAAGTLLTETTSITSSTPDQSPANNSETQWTVVGEPFAETPEAVVVDPAAGAHSDGNGVLEPGETVGVQTAWRNLTSSALALTGTASGLAGPSGPTYVLADAAAGYGSIPPDTIHSCTQTSNCFSISVSAPASRPATHWDVRFDETPSTDDETKTWTIHVGQSFIDVPKSQPFYKKIETLLHRGITSGCTATQYCPSALVSRGQMAIFIAKGIAGSGAAVPVSGTANGKPYNCVAGGVSIFADVLPTDSFCKHAHYLAAQNVTLGCSATQFCPSAPVDRDSMAGFVAKAIVAPAGGAGVPTTYGPDPVTGLSYSCNPGSPSLHFDDVPANDPFCKHVHYLWARGIVGGCGGGDYCPIGSVHRDEMAKFLANALGLLLYGP